MSNKETYDPARECTQARHWAALIGPRLSGIVSLHPTAVDERGLPSAIIVEAPGRDRGRDPADPLTINGVECYGYAIVRLGTPPERGVFAEAGPLPDAFGVGAAAYVDAHTGRGYLDRMRGPIGHDTATDGMRKRFRDAAVLAVVEALRDPGACGVFRTACVRIAKDRAERLSRDVDRAAEALSAARDAAASATEQIALAINTKW